MNFFEAVKIAENNKSIIGTEYNGATIEEIVIVPTNQTSFESWEREYVNSLDAQRSVVPFMNEDVEVAVVFDKFRIRQDNALIITSIDNVL